MIKAVQKAEQMSRKTPQEISGQVAQVFNLLYRRFPIGGLFGDSKRLWIYQSTGGLETRDTAGWKPALRDLPSLKHFLPDVELMWDLGFEIWDFPLCSEERQGVTR
jgi:hypothetical protein